MRFVALGVTLLVLATLAAGAAVESPANDARTARERSDWPALVEAAKAWIEAEPGAPAAHAHLALACAHLRRIDACVAALKAVESGGGSVDAVVRGFGVPMSEVVNALYSHCWANWDPNANRELWDALFEAFPSSAGATVPAARLLMAALKLDDEEARERLERWFDERTGDAANESSTESSKGNSSESSRDDPSEVGATNRPEGESDDRERTVRDPRAAYFYAQAYARAGIPGEKPLARAREAWTRAWESACREHRYEGPDAEGGDDLAKRERCDLSTDDEFNVLALTCVVNGAYDAPDNPLAAREVDPGVTFEDVTDATGLADVRGGRVAIGDWNEDGHPDVCVSGRLFRNKDGRGFEEVTQEIVGAHRGSSALFGDYDNDGLLDLLLPAQPHPKLLRNTGRKGGYALEDVTEASGMKAILLGAPPEGAAWLDADGDGWLDIYVAAYENPMSTGHADRLARNRGDGTFEDATESAGLAVDPPACGRGVAPADFDGDGDVDLYVSNYRLNPNFLFLSAGDGSFTRAAGALGVEGVRQPPDGSYYGHTIGSCAGDIDGDGDLDLFAANLAHPRFVFQGFSNLSMLYLNRASREVPGSGGSTALGFVEARRERGIRFQETHSDPAFVDYDNDGDLDLSITCVYEGVPSALYRNDGTGHFEPVTFRSRAVAFHGWGQAWFDYDGDGDLDWLVGSSGGVRLFRNRGNDHHWLSVRLLAKKTNRFGIGARVTVETLDGDESRTLVRELASARGTTSQDGELLHFGLGEYDGRVKLTVRWPDTLQEETQTVRTDRRVRVKQVRTTRRR